MAVNKEAWAQIIAGELSLPVKEEKKKLERQAMSHLEEVVTNIKSLLQLTTENGDDFGAARALRLLRSTEALYSDIQG